MKKKMCDHPAGILLVVVTVILFVTVNCYSMGNMQLTLLLTAVIVLIYFVFCLLCSVKEAEENKEK